ncbi:hypothetical protein Ahy_B07g087413 [Arachis hypogaea]|uniref:AMP-dependent synthetase/ligase domain-containing protein n=1 Tax=Arachis hypogaea TaxID=3818 RepID=A0A444YC36_ARAHY|nr:hypothetical protein Ahy_B07g087413 [Arachis hypogaea]
MEQLKPSAANSSPLTPLGFLDRAATVYGDIPSVIYDGVTFTWSDTRRRCLQLASALSSLGIRRGDVVSVVAPNIPAMYELHFAVPFAGAILNNINTRLDARTISVILRHAESKLVFVDTASRDVVLEALSLFPENNPRRPILIFIADDAVERLTPSSTVHFKDSYEGLISKGDPNFKWLYPNSEWDPMILNYTSGTTSSPKGVVHCHRGTFVMTVDSLIDWAVPKQPVYLWTLPMFHANGWSFPWGMAAVGGTNICVRKFDARIVFSLITRHRVTHMCGAPVVLNMLTNAPDNKPVEVESVLYMHPAVNEAAVVARPDEYWGETPCAFVSVKEGKAVTEKEIIEHCRKNMPKYMVPKTVAFREELPKTSTGKIQKFVLRQIAQEMGPIRHSKM